MEEREIQTETAFPNTISKETINGYPLRKYSGEIHLINKPDEVKAAVRALKREKILGFDTETKPTFRKGQNHPPALVQLAGKKAVYLFQLRELQALDGLTRIFSNPAILKAGVAINDDIRKLQEMTDFEPQGFVEIASITQPLGIVNTGLRSLTAIFLESRISKGAQITNWSRKELTPAQINYAATDAWISRELYLKLEELELIKKPKRKRRRRKRAPA